MLIDCKTSSTKTYSNKPPDPNEIEVSIFGPGYGESSLLHLGGNEWLLVDSCINPITREPAAFTYLRSIGINPAEAIRLIFITHWHDDHIRGISKVFQECESATVIWSSALSSKEFLTLAYAYGTRPMIETSGVQEFYNILEIIKERYGLNSKKFVPIKLASADKLIWRRSAPVAGANMPCEVYSLSPSDISTFLALKEIGKLLPQDGYIKRRILANRPNYFAVVLWIKIQNINILLGSDLEESNDPNSGWLVIVNSNTRPEGKASIFKIPHHGSKNGDNPRVWSEMLESEPVAVLTPFDLGRTKLPTKSDIKRICKYTSKAYSTAISKIKRKKGREKIVDKTIRETVINIRTVNPSFGYIRMRTNNVNDLIKWEIELFGDAVPLDRLLNI